MMGKLRWKRGEPELVPLMMGGMGQVWTGLGQVGQVWDKLDRFGQVGQVHKLGQGLSAHSRHWTDVKTYKL